MDRRSFLTVIGTSLIAAPAIARAASLMPLRGIVMPVGMLWSPWLYRPMSWTTVGLERLWVLKFVRDGLPVRIEMGNETVRLF